MPLKMWRSWELTVEDGWKCALGRGFSVPKEGTSEGAGAMCHPRQGRDTLKGMAFGVGHVCQGRDTSE